MMRAVSMMVLSLALAPAAIAQQAPAAPLPHSYVLNPGQPLASSSDTLPGQQGQALYHTLLQNRQREELQDNPSGSTRDELAIQHQLNQYESAPRQ